MGRGEVGVSAVESKRGMVGVGGRRRRMGRRRRVPGDERID